MESYQAVFLRYEEKYLLGRSRCEALARELARRTDGDPFAWHTVSNLYFDTDCYDIIRASVARPAYKEKLRLRSYGVPGPRDPVFLELKKKCRGLVSKRRERMTLDAARAFMRGELPATGQVLRELDWFQRRYRSAPRVFIAYERAAVSGREEPDLRVTFDRGLRFRETCLDLAQGTWGTPLLVDDVVLMEIKVAHAMPAWLARLLSEQCVYPVSFSKYGFCYQSFIARRTSQKGGFACA
ncbi:MAG: polyphosphate polymerase domain-containing protein [Syntrophomonadaceae bacterium]|nr:polyphosphate polymerase domain-containing protein [Syntrophomonadaceae bacterium]MDH7497699.1 polyphosphate polymerase domain-containing protein [Syntrophomonadaceae bacterium]